MATVHNKPMGRVSIDAMEFLYPNYAHMIRREIDYTIPEGVSVKTFYEEQVSHSFVLILESDVPIEGWTYIVPMGEYIPIAEAWGQRKARDVQDETPVDYMVNNHSLGWFMSQIMYDQDFDRLDMDMKLVDYLKTVHNRACP
jgi:hypothetical protein